MGLSPSCCVAGVVAAAVSRPRAAARGAGATIRGGGRRTSPPATPQPRRRHCRAVAQLPAPAVPAPATSAPATEALMTVANASLKAGNYGRPWQAPGRCWRSIPDMTAPRGFGTRRRHAGAFRHGDRRRPPPPFGSAISKEPHSALERARAIDVASPTVTELSTRLGRSGAGAEQAERAAGRGAPPARAGRLRRRRQRHPTAAAPPVQPPSPPPGVRRRPTRLRTAEASRDAVAPGTAAGAVKEPRCPHRPLIAAARRRHHRLLRTMLKRPPSGR